MKKLSFLLLSTLFILFSCDNTMDNMVNGVEGGGGGLPEVNITTFAVTGNSITINWEDLSFDEYEGVTITCSDGTSEKLAPGIQTCEIDGLTDGAEYAITIKTSYSQDRESKGYSVNISADSNEPEYHSIETAAELAAIGSNLGWDYIQLCDIDLSGYQSGTGWTPIGPFTGEYNGGNHKITGLVVDSAVDYVGLFSSINGATISNLNIVGADITGKKYVGGLVGIISNASKVINCSVSGTITGDMNTGGLVGKNGGEVVECYSTGNVYGKTNTGGLVGWNETIINCSYSTGNVDGDINTGGLIGMINTSSTAVSYCYSTGKITGTLQTGGLIGNYQEGTLEYLYWNTTVNTPPGLDDTGDVSPDHSDITGLTTDQMRDLVNFDTYYVSWDFSESGEWDIDGTTNNGYPFLRNNRP